MLEIRTEHHGAVAVVHLAGDLAGLDVDRAGQALNEATEAPSSRVIIDLAETRSISSSGLGQLMACVSRSRLRGGEVVLLSPTPFVRGVLTVTRLDKWFEIFDTLEAAQARLESA